MIDTILSFLAPHHCYGCSKIGKVICDNCKYNITNEPFDGCIGCGGPVLRQGVCGSCHLPYARAWAADTYHGPLGEAIKGMKFGSVREAASVLGEILAATLPAVPPQTVVVPIPTVRSHVRQRGFDHTKLIATAMAHHLGVATADVIQRVGHAAQRGATARQRQVQAKAAFRVEGALDPDGIYLVVDDVVTTGATIRQAGLQLQRAGAKELWVATLTRDTLD